MAALFLGVGFFELDEIAMADVTAMRVAEVGAKKVESERVAFHVFNERSNSVSAIHTERFQ